MNLPPHTHTTTIPGSNGKPEKTRHLWSTPNGVWTIATYDSTVGISGPGVDFDRTWPDQIDETELTALLVAVGAIEPEIVDVHIYDDPYDEPRDLSWKTYEPKLIARIREHFDNCSTLWRCEDPTDVDTRDVAEVAANFIRDNFNFDALEHPDWKPPTNDSMSVDEWLTERTGAAVRVRRSGATGGAWLSTTRSNSGAHMTVVEVQRTIFALARAANINVRVDGALYPTGTDPELAVRRGGIVAAALAAGQDPGWAAPQTDELKAAEDGRVAYISVSLTVEQDMIATSVRCPEPERHHIRHGWKASVDSEEIYVCPGDPRPERP